MKKFIMILLTLLPCLVGYLINSILVVPIIGMLLYYILPLLVLVFWFWLGFRYSKTDLNAIQSILIGNAVSIALLILYLWQFLGQNDKTRNTFLAGLSQSFVSATPTYLTIRLAVLFETQPDYIGQASMTAMNIISVIIMMAIFTAGFFWGRNFIQNKTSGINERF